MINRIKITVVATFLMCLVLAMSSFASIAVTASGVDYSVGENFDSTCYREIEEPENYLKVAESAVKAHVEVYIPETVGMLYYTLSDEELMELKSVLLNTTVKSANPFAADFTTTIHLFREDDSYVFVVAMDEDLNGIQQKSTRSLA